MKSSFHSLISILQFILNYLRVPSPELSPILDRNSSNDLFCSFITPQHGPLRKHSLFVVEKASLLIRRLAMGVLMLRAYVSTGMCLPSRYLAMGLYVTVRNVQRIYFFSMALLAPSGPWPLIHISWVSTFYDL
jgi:hypothetical protein